MAAVNLAAPAIAHFDLAITSGRAVPNHEVIGQAILHTANPAMVVIEHLRVSLSRAAVMNNDKLPAIARHRRAANLFDHSPAQISVAAAVRPRTGPRPKPD